MACEFIKLPNGQTLIGCRRGPKRKCSVCSKPASRLCDFKLSGGKTCDKPLCSSCAVHSGANLDFCPGHPQRQLVINTAELKTVVPIELGDVDPRVLLEPKP